MADLTQTRLLKRKANSIWLWPTSIARFCSFPLHMASCFFLPRVLLAPQIPVNRQVSREEDCVWLGMLQKDFPWWRPWQISLRSNIPRPEKCNCKVAWGSVILKVRACSVSGAEAILRSNTPNQCRTERGSHSCCVRSNQFSRPRNTEKDVIWRKEQGFWAKGWDERIWKKSRVFLV